MRRDLAFAPEVRAQRPAGDGTIRHMVDGGGKGPRAHVDAVLVKFRESPVDCPRVDSAGCGNLGSGVALGQIDPHAIQYPTFWESRKRVSPENGEIAENATNTDNLPMPRPRKPRETDPWRQRDRFMALVDAKVAEGVPLKEIAHALGLRTANSLEKAYRYDHARIPKWKTIELAAAYFDVEQAEIYGDALPTTEADRARLFLVSTGMGSDDVSTLTDEQVTDAWRVAVASAMAVLAK